MTNLPRVSARRCLANRLHQGRGYLYRGDLVWVSYNCWRVSDAEGRGRSENGGLHGSGICWCGFSDHLRVLLFCLMTGGLRVGVTGVRVTVAAERVLVGSFYVEVCFGLLFN